MPGNVGHVTRSRPPASPPASPHGDGPAHRHPGDGWVDCSCGRRHWGLNGAAGVLVVRLADDGRTPEAVVLQHRALWSDQGGTWGIPGGAVADDESALAGGLRETQEEAGIEPGELRVVATVVLDHHEWSYTTIVAVEADGARVEPSATDPESLEVAWVPLRDVPGLPLLRAFEQHLPLYLAALARGLTRRRGPAQ